MKRRYRAHNDPIKGWCAELSTDNFRTWKQVSFWYTTLKRLCYYFGLKNGLILDPETNFFVPKYYNPNNVMSDIRNDTVFDLTLTKGGD